MEYLFTSFLVLNISVFCIDIDYTKIPLYYFSIFLSMPESNCDNFIIDDSSSYIGQQILQKKLMGLHLITSINA